MILALFFLHLWQNMALKKNNHINTFTDEELLTKYKESGHTEYFGVLYSQYVPLLYGMSLKYLCDENKAYAAVVDLFEDLLPQINDFEINHFRTWLYRAALDHCMQILLKENEDVRIDTFNESTESDEILHLLCEERDNNERMQAMQNCLSRLPDGQRVSITHFFTNEMSYADIAEKTGYSLHTVKNNIRNGKRSLWNCLNKFPK